MILLEPAYKILHTAGEVQAADHLSKPDSAADSALVAQDPTLRAVHCQLLAMSANVQPAPISQRIVTNRAVAVFFILSSAWSLYQRVRHVSARFWVPEYFWMPRIFHGATGITLDLLMLIGFVIVMLGLFGSTRDHVEKIGIAVCGVSVITNPLKMLFPTYAAAFWWFNLGFLMTFFLASVAVLIRLSRPNWRLDKVIDPPTTA